MGTVYKAVDPLTRRTVAIRTITLDRSKPECAEFEARFHHETSAGRLSHANIVAIHDVGVTDDFAYVAMEYVEGETLREMLDSGVVLPVETIASIVERVANALNYAHENHMVHCDIKPANILITPGRDVKIKDFGIAQIPTGLHPLHGPMLGIMGTPQYMAPEQLAGGNTDGRTDIFALGVVLYEMLTGVMPFDGDELGAIIDQVLKAEPAPPSMLNRRVPPAFDRIISRALAKRPRDRYQTASAFAWDVRNPDAAPPRETRGPAAGSKPAKAVQESRPPAEGPDTTSLPPSRAVGKGIAGRFSAGGNRIKEEKPSLLGAARLRKPLLLALPLVIIAAFVVVFQGLRPRSDELATALPTPAVPATPAAPATPALPAEPEVPAEPTVAASPGVSAEPKAAIAAKATATAKPKLPAKPTVPAKAGVTAMPGVPESGTVPPPVAEAQPKAVMALAISPWGEVLVDGNRVGVSPPLATLQLEPGKHEVEIRNQGFAPYRETVNLKPGASIKIRHKFK